MRITLRLILSLTVGIAVVAFLFAFLQVREVTHGMQQETKTRVATLADSLEEAVEPALALGSRPELRRIVERFQTWEHLAGTAIYDERGRAVVATKGADEALARRALGAAQPASQDAGYFYSADDIHLFVYVLPIWREKRQLGKLLIFYPTGSLEKRGAHLWRDAFLRALAQVGLIALVTLLIIRWSIFGPMTRTIQWLRDLRTGNFFRKPRLPETGVLRPLEQEVTHLVKSLESARAAAEEEARLREARASLWTAERLRAHVRGKIQDNPLFVVSNREPYMHVRRGNKIDAVVPPSGLVTALEPILCACNGTWIAHGSGDADSQIADSRGRLRVPPDQQEYTLRRVWLTKEEEEGYYYGFANEGLWPLCHIAHTRPIFRASDWPPTRRPIENSRARPSRKWRGLSRPSCWFRTTTLPCSPA